MRGKCLPGDVFDGGASYNMMFVVRDNSVLRFLVHCHLLSEVSHGFNSRGDMGSPKKMKT